MEIINMWYFKNYYGYSTKKSFGYVKIGDIKNQKKELKEAIFVYCLRNNFKLFEK